MGYPAQESKKNHFPFVVVTSIIWWNLLISPKRAQQQNRIERMMISKEPSYYYNLCAPTVCNNITLTYPFTIPSPCHPFFMKPSCAKDNGTLYTTSVESNNSFRIFPANFTADSLTTSFVKAYNPLFSCGPISKPNYFEPIPASEIYPVDYNVGTHLNCTTPIPAGALQGLQNASCLGCPGQDPNNTCFYAPGMVSYPNCETYNMYSKSGFNVSAEKDLRGYLQRGYEMRYTKSTECRGCEATGGRCGVNPSFTSSESFVCFCPSTVHTFNCSDVLVVELDGVPAKGHGSKLLTPKVIIILGIGLGAGLAFICIGYFYFKERWRRQDQAGDFDGEDDAAVRRYLEGDNKTIPAYSIDIFLRNYTLGRPTRFSYKQLKKYTNNFSHKLGQGGNGSVFKGELHSGLFIAVKLLDDGNDQHKAQFLNEVRIIGQIHHNNLLRLLGYCFENSRQAVLVYEFMENGSLDKYIHGNFLSLNQLHDIAVGVAKGIMYLHEDCSTRILHCDIKPHNILLDQNFRPKVSDFGLAVALSREKSHVSLTDGAGTPGYAPPEMWMNCGNLSEKSDVYSFGMVLLEMVGRKRSNLVTDVSSSLSDQMYFPEWVFLQHHEVVNPSSSSGGVGGSSEWHGSQVEEGGIAKRMELVALWCIQFEQSKRPSMRRVSEMLEGDVVIAIPPAQFNPRPFSNIY